MLPNFASLYNRIFVKPCVNVVPPMGALCPISQISLRQECRHGTANQGARDEHGRPTELRRRAEGRSTEHRNRFRVEIILLRLDEMKIALGNRAFARQALKMGLKWLVPPSGP